MNVLRNQHRQLPKQLYYDDSQEERGGLSGIEMAICEKINRVLEHHYPGYPWIIWAKLEAGIATIRLADISDRYGLPIHGNLHYIIKLEDLKSDPSCRLALRGAGELLERWQQPRGRYRRECWLERAPAFSDFELKSEKKYEQRQRLQAILNQFGQPMTQGATHA